MSDTYCSSLISIYSVVYDLVFTKHTYHKLELISNNVNNQGKQWGSSSYIQLL